MVYAEFFLVLGFGTYFLYVLIHRAAESRRRNPLRLPLPPGPPGLPLVGNVLDWPQGSSWLKFSEWQAEFGNITRIKLLNQNVLVLNSYGVAKDLLEQPHTASRPRFPMAGELMTFENSTILSPYNSHWKFLRKLTRHAISSPVIPKYWPYLEADSRELVQLLMEDPEGYRDSLFYMLGKNVLKTAYGLDIKSRDDEYITVATAVHDDLSIALLPGGFLVDVIPALKYVPEWMPGAKFQRIAAQARLKAYKMVELSYQFSKRSFDLGKAQPSFVNTLLEREGELSNGSSDWGFVVKWAAASLYGAAIGTSNAALTTFLLLMAMHPDIQKKAQEELDSVVGQGRFPTLADRARLSYVEAVLKETVRWHPPLPISLPHQTTQDSVFRDYYIPDKTIIIVNAWAISQDAELYPNPSNFNPERFMGDTPALNPYGWIFGFGRRECPGKHYATAFIFIAIATILSAFDIKAEDENGSPVKITPKFSSNFTSFAEPFPCRIVPRSERLAELLSNTGVSGTAK